MANFNKTFLSCDNNKLLEKLEKKGQLNYFEYSDQEVHWWDKEKGIFYIRTRNGAPYGECMELSSKHPKVTFITAMINEADRYFPTRVAHYKNGKIIKEFNTAIEPMEVDKEMTVKLPIKRLMEAVRKMLQISTPGYLIPDTLKINRLRKKMKGGIEAAEELWNIIVEHTEYITEEATE